MVKDCQFTLAAIQKTLPSTREEFDEFRVVSRGRGPVPEPSECDFGQALELGATDGEMTRHLEMKNERFN